VLFQGVFYLIYFYSELSFFEGLDIFVLALQFAEHVFIHLNNLLLNFLSGFVLKIS